MAGLGILNAASPVSCTFRIVPQHAYVDTPGKTNPSMSLISTDAIAANANLNIDAQGSLHRATECATFTSLMMSTEF